MLDKMTYGIALCVFGISAAQVQIHYSGIKPTAFKELPEIVIVNVLCDKTVVYLRFGIADSKGKQPVP